MHIAVIYQNGDCELVIANHLGELIDRAEIKQFLRLEGWVTIGVNTIRKEFRVDYKGLEKRQQFVSLHDDNLLNIKLNI